MAKHTWPTSTRTKKMPDDDENLLGEKPDCDEDVEDHASERRGRHEGPDHIAVEMVHQIPAGVHEPCETYEHIRTEAEVSDHSAGDGSVEQATRRGRRSGTRRSLVGRVVAFEEVPTAIDAMAN